MELANTLCSFAGQRVIICMDIKDSEHIEPF